MSRNSDSSISFGVGLLFGVLAGVAAGILLSPKSGDEMRKDFKDIAGKLTNNVHPELQSAHDVTAEMINKIKFTVEKQIIKVNEALKAGRMAAAKRKEELESGYNY